MSPVIWIYFASINAVAFAATALDKLFAIRSMRRVRESTLLLLAVVGGALGAYLAMEICRHKTKKPLFFIGVPLVLLLWIAVLVLVHN